MQITDVTATAAPLIENPTEATVESFCETCLAYLREAPSDERGEDIAVVMQHVLPKTRETLRGMHMGDAYWSLIHALIPHLKRVGIMLTERDPEPQPRGTVWWRAENEERQKKWRENLAMLDAAFEARHGEAVLDALPR